MSEIEYKKSLIGEEDLLLGFGTVNQTRGGVTLPIKKINSSTIPYNNDASIKTILDSNVFTIDSLEDFSSVPSGFETVIVKDINRGGTFVSKTVIEIDPNTGELYEANDVTVFEKLGGGFWARRYSGAVNVKWAGAKDDWDGTTGTDNTDAFNRAIQASGKFGGIVKFKGRYGVRSSVLINKYGVSLQGTNTLQDSIEAFDWQSGLYIIDCAVDGSTTTGFTHSKFTVNGNNQPVANMRIERPYDNCDMIDVNLYKTNDDYHCLVLGGDSISQTIYMRNILAMHNGINPTVPSVLMQGLQECKFDLCKFWGAKYVGGTPYSGDVKSLHIKNCRSLQFDSLSIISSEGVFIEAIGQDIRQITFRNIVFEDVNGFIETVGESSANSVNEVLILNPRHESPASGSYIFGAYTNYSSIKSNIYLINLIMNILSAYNKAEILYSSTVTDSGTKNSIEYYPDGTTATQRFNNNLAVLKHNTPSSKLEVIGRTDNDTGLSWDASSSVDNGLYIRKSGEVMTRYYAVSGIHRSAFYANNISVVEATQFGFRPVTDNLYPLGGASNRWSVVYAGTGVINTSDDREKTYLDITEIEKQVALELKSNMKKFKFNDSIKEKGEYDARIHFGASAQTVKSIFEKHGLAAEDYAILCYDEWEDEYEDKVINEAVIDEDGNIVKEAIVEKLLVTPAGNRYGLRYEELLCFIMSAL